jgi:single-strand DNA-binding protein
LQILGTRNSGENMGDGSQNWGQSANNSSSAPVAATPEPPMDFDDDIPF